jgi:hypothetical protein
MSLRPVTSVIITWMDGRQETYPFNRSEVKDGELHIWTEYPGSRAVAPQRKDEYWFPLVNIRARSVAGDRA